MAAEENLYDRLRAGDLDSAELSQIALEYFRSARDISPMEVIFGGFDDKTYALKFVYKKQTRALAQVLAGPSLSEMDIAALRAIIDIELEQPHFMIATQVFFTHISVEGCFRYRDAFQILPIPAGSPRGSSLWGGNPFLLQFNYRAGTSVSMPGYRRAAEARRIRLLLNGLLEDDISDLRGSGFRWVRTQDDPSGSGFKTEYCQEMYDFPDSGKFRNCPSLTQTEGIPLLSRIEPQEYFTRELAINDPGRVLQIPANLEELFDRFFSSSAGDQNRFLRACYWFDHARMVSAYSDSAAFTALIRAIESLIPDDKSVGKCPVCTRPTGKGSTRRLTEFLDAFAPASPKFQEGRARLYWEFRSRLSHGGELSFRDRTGFFADLTPVAIEERMLAQEVWQLVKIVLVNWLHSRCPLLVAVRRG